MFYGKTFTIWTGLFWLTFPSCLLVFLFFRLVHHTVSVVIGVSNCFGFGFLTVI